MLERFESKIEKIPEAGCWLWTGAVLKTGYGAFGVPGKTTQRAHRVAWGMYAGVIPKHMCVLHRCDVRLCVNPHHLFLGTYKENADDMFRKQRNKIGFAGIASGVSVTRKNQTHCKRGHEYTSENTRLRPIGRDCKQCARERQKRTSY